ncbi:hypothetical protein BAUCODRAFT_374180 [Baudoinia panamericana UAMH 10762]|uniref:Uncharacterized protein n=1 Tax=Baudoinia panamericana (strain UAMH 10762) TaxID=717646 RepID=M2LVC5_BAUPA|nr:uncharacterized protein BAUCODRAFT_374180 [Baudoinia panamericana UAMH 10762]EMC98572.1 hypothetical protein BAUCODRAFT_374180 [Baudoinia panamericana UAMH 10762]
MSAIIAGWEKLNCIRSRYGKAISMLCRAGGGTSPSAPVLKARAELGSGWRIQTTKAMLTPEGGAEDVQTDRPSEAFNVEHHHASEDESDVDPEVAAAEYTANNAANLKPFIRSGLKKICKHKVPFRLLATSFHP